MGMGIEDNELVVAKTIEHEAGDVFPLAIKVSEFNVRSLTASEVEIALERLKRKGIVSSYRRGWGLIIKHVTNGKEDKHFTFERTGDEPIYDEGDGLRDDEVFEIEFDASKLRKYLSSARRGDSSKQKMLEKRGEDFYLNGKKIPFDTNTSIHRSILDILFDDDGSSKSMSYEDINAALEKPPYRFPKLTERKKIIERIKNAIHNGLYRQAGADIQKRVEIEARKGLTFDNPPTP